MMRITKIIALAAAFTALAACTKEQEPNVISFEKGQKVTLNVTTSYPETKVTSELYTASNAEEKDSVRFKWQEGDTIKVTVNGSSAEFFYVSGSDSATATFEGLMPASGTTFDVQYPVDEPDLTTQTYSSTEVLPHNKMKFAATKCQLVGGTSPIHLTPQYSGLKLNLYGTNQTVSKLVVVDTTSSGKPSYTLTIDPAVTLPETDANAKPFFVVVPSGTYGFRVDVYDTVRFCSLATTSRKELIQGKIHNMQSKLVRKITLSGAFSVSPTTQVYFSCGNMYYNSSDSKFYFEDKQYLYPSSWDTDHIGHFRWVKNTGVIETDIASAIDTLTTIPGKPYTTDVFFTNSTHYDTRDDFTVEGETNKWRTCHTFDFQHMLEDRIDYGQAPEINGKTGCMYAEVKVTGICGILIFPDIFTWPSDVSLPPSTTTYNTFESNWNGLNYTLDEFASLEKAGCVFLPATGIRSEKTIKECGESGCYSTSYTNKTSKGTRLYFNSTQARRELEDRYLGSSIRLVVDAQ